MIPIRKRIPIIDIDDQIESEQRTSRINSAGQKIRGKDLNWRSKITFSSAQLYYDSSLFKELKTSFTLKRNQEADYGVVHKYICNKTKINCNALIP